MLSCMRGPCLAPVREMRSPHGSDILWNMRSPLGCLLALAGLVSCDPSLDAPDGAGFDGRFDSRLDLRVVILEGGREVTELRDEMNAITAIRLGVEQLEWRADVSDDVGFPVHQSFDLFAGETIEGMRLPPGRYSGVDLHARTGAWGDAVRVEWNGEVMGSDEFELETRCEEPLELRVGEHRSVTLEIDADELLQRLRDVDMEPSELDSLLEAVQEAADLRCDG